VTDGDSLRVATAYDHPSATLTGPTVSGGKVKVDTAKIHFGSMATLDLKYDDLGATVGYAGYPDTAADYWTPVADTRYGARGSKLVGSAGGSIGLADKYGIDFAIAIPSVATVTLDLNSVKWADATTGIATDAAKNKFGFRAKASLSAVTNLTFEAAFGTQFGGKDQKYDSGIGGKVGYKIALNDTYSITPSAALNYGMFTSRATPKNAMALSGGVLFAWGAKTKTPDLYFSDDTYDAYPGVSVAVTMTGKDYPATATAKDVMGLNIGFLSGSLVPNLTAMAAFAIQDLNAEKQKMGFEVVGKYAITADKLTITPKFGLNYFNDATKATKGTEAYVKLGVDVGGLINNTTLSVAWDSNDMINGKNTTIGTTTTDDKMGKLTVTCKVAF